MKHKEEKEEKGKDWNFGKVTSPIIDTGPLN